MNETALLLFIHGYATPWLDGLFILSHRLGTLPACLALVLGSIAWHAARREWRAVLLWLLVGVSTGLLFLGLKPAFGRARPNLWTPLVTESGYAFPSGHALASATFYPLLAWLTLGLRGKRFLAFSIGLPLFVGFGRLYLCVHWPTDVLAGWLLGAAQATAGILWARAGAVSSPSPAPDRAADTARGAGA